MIQDIERCNTGRELGDIIRNNSNLFHSKDAIKALNQRFIHLKPNMKSRDIVGLLNILSKARVPRTARQVQKNLMSSLSDLALESLEYFSARDISMLLNAMAKQRIRNDLSLIHISEPTRPY